MSSGDGVRLPDSEVNELELLGVEVEQLFNSSGDRGHLPDSEVT